MNESLNQLKPISVYSQALKYKKLLFFLVSVFMFTGGIWFNRLFLTPKTDASIPISNKSACASIPPVQDNCDDRFGMSKNAYGVLPSLNGEFFALFYGLPNDSQHCRLEMINKVGNGYAAKDIFGLDTVPCSYGMGNFSTSFRWVDDLHFTVHESNQSPIKIYDFDRYTPLEEYVFDANNLTFLYANKTLDRWLFFDKSKQDRRNYVVKDRQGSVIKEVDLGKKENDGKQDVLYDEVNDGFFFASNVYLEEETQKAVREGQDVDNGIFITKFDFLSAGDLNLRNLLTTKQHTIAGRGCSANYLSSAPGIVVLVPQCIQFPSEYLEDGKLQLRL